EKPRARSDLVVSAKGCIVSPKIQAACAGVKAGCGAGTPARRVGTLADALRIHMRTTTRRHECRRGGQECPRYGCIRINRRMACAVGSCSCQTSTISEMWFLPGMYTSSDDTPAANSAA